MQLSVNTLQARVDKWRQATWPIKSIQLALAAAVALFVWPAVIGVAYSIIVRSKLRSRRPVYGLITVMAVSCSVAQGAWLQWLSSDIIAGQPATVAVADPVEPASAGEVAGTSAHSPTSTLEAQVIKVVNGSFMEVTINDQLYQVQLIGITAPDPGSHSAPPACFGQESQRYLQGLIGSGRIQLSTDEQLSDRNEFGVMLRYALAADGSLINRQMLDAGMVRESGGDAYQQKVSFIGAQEAAKAAKRGLWASCETAEPSPTPGQPVSTPTPTTPVSAISKAVLPIAPTAAPAYVIQPSIPTPTPPSTTTPTPTPTPSLTPTSTPTPSPT